ncbi:STAS domain-containing protein [Actinoplanes sp. NPDC049548]|uniref:STAS domain-containing protein n=1 Tax=Actinoplanes sp. NPDC049548 TaxID=3155152 RepID=UPI0034208FCD
MGEAVVDTTRTESQTVVRVRGELDMDTAASLRQVLVDQVERGGLRELVVDLAHLIFMDSTGIGALVAGYGAAQQAGVRFVVRNPSEFVYRQLAITGLAELFGCPGPTSRRHTTAPG